MTAIVVALGGKTTATHRASSLKNFIRTGAKSVHCVCVDVCVWMCGCGCGGGWAGVDVCECVWMCVSG